VIDVAQQDIPGLWSAHTEGMLVGLRISFCHPCHPRLLVYWEGYPRPLQEGLRLLLLLLLLVLLLLPLVLLLLLLLLEGKVPSTNCCKALPKADFDTKAPTGCFAACRVLGRC